MYVLVMAGGQGTRFWPESTSKRPKQYLQLLGTDSLLVQTLRRFEGMVVPANRYVVTVAAQVPLVADSAHEYMGPQNIIEEPAGRNTAPCILLALAELVARGARPEQVVTIVPADHVICNTTGFQQVLKKAQAIAASNSAIITIGIPPYFPHTGYGYIRKAIPGADVAADLPSGVYAVAGFTEKPNLAKAQEYLQTGEYLWNGGMFIGTIQTFLEEFARWAPEIFRFYPQLVKARECADRDQTVQLYQQIPPNSIDYAVMEKSQRVLVIPAEFDWNDLGSWDALEQVIAAREGNTIVQAREVFTHHAQGNIVFAPGKFVSLLEVNNLIVVVNEQSVVVLPKSHSQQIKLIVDYLKSHPELGHDLL